MEKQTINLSLTIEEANLMLEALGQMPFNKVYSLIGKIQQQASQQLNGTPSDASNESLKIEE